MPASRWLGSWLPLVFTLLPAASARRRAAAGVGDDHAKWSPVATTWYRLMPEVVLLQQPRGKIAEELVEQLPGLLQLLGSGDHATVVVGDAWQHDKLLEKVGWQAVQFVLGCVCRQGGNRTSAAWRHIFRRPLLAAPGVMSLGIKLAPPVPQVRRLSGEERYMPYLQLRKIKDHFIFTIESTGAWRPHELFKYAVQLMVSKCDKVLEGLQAFPARSFKT